MKLKKFTCICLVSMLVLGSSVSVSANSTTPKFDVGDRIAGVIKEDGSLWMWGNNEYGEYGNGEIRRPEHGAVPEFTKTQTSVKQVSFGTYYSTYILKSNGTLWSCGRNQSYALGDGATDNRIKPVKLLSKVVAVDGGSDYAMALKSDGTLYAWGSGRAFGEEGNVQKPIKIYKKVRAFACGADYCAIITKNNKLYTAGNGQGGRLGIPQKKAESVTRKGFSFVMKKVASVSCSKYVTLIVDKKGALWSCGRNTYGELLNGETGDAVYQPIRVVKSGVKGAVCYESESIYITKSGELYGAGNNLYGQFGLGWSMTNPNLSFEEQQGKIYKLAENVTDAAIGSQ